MLHENRPGTREEALRIAFFILRNACVETNTNAAQYDTASISEHVQIWVFGIWSHNSALRSLLGGR